MSNIENVTRASVDVIRIGLTNRNCRTLSISPGDSVKKTNGIGLPERDKTIAIIAHAKTELVKLFDRDRRFRPGFAVGPFLPVSRRRQVQYTRGPSTDSRDNLTLCHGVYGIIRGRSLWVRLGKI